MSDLPAGYERFSPEARSGQLIEFAFLCRTLAEEFESHTERFSAELHAAAQEAERLTDEGYDQHSLTRLAEMFPPDPVWMHPSSRCWDAFGGLAR